MSVIVKGIEMPECCAGCFAISDSLGWCKASGNDIYSPFSMDGRPSFCPLRPLPEKHGRLIDAKVLDVAFTALRFNDDGTLRHWDDRKNWCLHGSEVESLIADAPTIVEAEGE